METGTGRITSVSPYGDYAFIKPDARGRDIFVHARVLKAAGISPELGLRLAYAAALDPRHGKPAAVEVRLERA